MDTKMNRREQFGAALVGARCGLVACTVLLLSGLSAVAMAEGKFCNRNGDGVCVPMEQISNPLWSMADGAPWTVFQPWTYLQPKPVFGSDNALMQFFVSQNADSDKCGSSPQLVSSQVVSFGYTFSPTGLLSNEIRYTDPPVTIGSYAVEEILQYYHWTVLNHAVPKRYCEEADSAIGFARRSVGVCPSGFYPYIASIPGPTLTWPLSTIIHDPDICFKPIYSIPRISGIVSGRMRPAGIQLRQQRETSFNAKLTSLPLFPVRLDWSGITTRLR